MTFSLFTFIFTFTVTVLFYCLGKGARLYVLLFASLFYAAYLDLRSLYFLVVSTLIVYAAGLLLDGMSPDDPKKNNRVAAAFVVLMILAMLVIKFIPRYIHKLPISVDARDAILRNLILPIGFSYYGFQAIGYILDIKKGSVKAERNLVRFALYMCFFPKFVSGPIEKAEDFLSQLDTVKKAKLFNEDRLSRAMTYLVYGYLMKTVIGDRMGIYAGNLFGDYVNHGYIWLIIGSFLYTMQIYCDFAGYSAIAIGVAKLFDITLTQNFFSPYLSDNISEFWRRWHISLSLWLREYVYIPLGGNRKGFVRRCINMMIVFFICGIWHGDSLGFVAWGLLHGLYSVWNAFLIRSGIKIHHIIKRIMTFLSVSVAWIFFGQSSLRNALGYIMAIMRRNNPDKTFMVDMQIMELKWSGLCLIILGIVMAFVMDIKGYIREKPFPEVVAQGNYVLRYLFLYFAIIVIFIFGIYGTGYDASMFMYMDF
ncbi:MAG: hypothetical protein K6E53_01455 [Lachnospiraceae bacterium]|nr:hypothetical protein [Lachnospiraceae bacterium]